jgi:predicted transcriptional regulator
MNQDTTVSDPAKAFTARLPKPLDRRLSLAALDRETSKNAILQEAVTEYLDRLELAKSIRGGKKKHGQTS